MKSETRLSVLPTIRIRGVEAPKCFFRVRTANIHSSSNRHEMHTPVCLEKQGGIPFCQFTHCFYRYVSATRGPRYGPRILYTATTNQYATICARALEPHVFSPVCRPARSQPLLLSCCKRAPLSSAISQRMLTVLVRLYGHRVSVLCGLSGCWKNSSVVYQYLRLLVSLSLSRQITNVWR